MADTVYAADGLTGIQSMLILGVTFLLVCMLTEYGDSYFRARFFCEPQMELWKRI